jgi:general secretion pathway protein E/type IV pilus assembly protein PilB
MGDMIEQGVPVRELRAAARTAGVESVREDGVRKVLDGETSIAELRRAIV